MHEAVSGRAKFATIDSIRWAASCKDSDICNHPKEECSISRMPKPGKEKQFLRKPFKITDGSSSPEILSGWLVTQGKAVFHDQN
jgi:hypothetical protein